jgi:hypothetical protein
MTAKSKLLHYGCILLHGALVGLIMVAVGAIKLRIWVIFGLCLLLYAHAIPLLGSPPFTAEKGAIWFSELGPELQAAVLGATLTISGFFVAIVAASRAWKTQIRDQMRLQAAEHIDSFFGQVSSLVRTQSVYIEALLEQKRASASNPQMMVDWSLVRGLVEDASSFKQARTHLSSLSVEAHLLASKHSPVLMSVFSSTKLLEAAVDALGKVTERMWIRLPANPATAREFLDAVDLEPCEEFAKQADASNEDIGDAVSLLRQRLLSTMTEPGWELPFLMARLRGDVLASLPRVVYHYVGRKHR